MPAFSLGISRIGLTPHKHIISIEQSEMASQETLSRLATRYCLMLITLLDLSTSSSQVFIYFRKAANSFLDLLSRNFLTLSIKLSKRCSLYRHFVIIRWEPQLSSVHPRVRHLPQSVILQKHFLWLKFNILIIDFNQFFLIILRAIQCLSPARCQRL